jgi:hypothetical protein
MARAEVPFAKTPRQFEAVRLLNSARHVMLYGGARSGKTFIAVRQIFLRAVKRPSRHLLCRFRFNHAKVSLAHDTVPSVLAKCFPPDLKVEFDKVDSFWRVPCEGGGTSEVWLGGVDDKERVEKILGTEFSTIYANECSQISHEAITTLWTRLAETSGLTQRFFYDCNPPGKKHWTHRMFMDGVHPSGEKHGLQTAYLQMNPAHNAANLAPEYLQALEGLPRRQRQRYLEGLYLADVEGALWSDAMITAALVKEPAPVRKTVVAVDPSVSSSATSDECGIVVCALDEKKDGIVEGDHSGKMTTRAWAKKVVDLFHAYEANEVVAEVNQGGDLVEDAIHNIDRHVPVVKVHAAKGKFARAEPIAQLYELGRVAHRKAMPELEAELTETVFSEVKSSPNRLDAVVWGLTHLMRPKSGPRVHIG